MAVAVVVLALSASSGLPVAAKRSDGDAMGVTQAQTARVVDVPAAAAVVQPTSYNGQGVSNQNHGPSAGDAASGAASEAASADSVPASSAVTLAVPLGGQRVAQVNYPDCPLNLFGPTFPLLTPGNHIFNTDALTIDGNVSPGAFASGGLAIFPFATITVPAGVTIQGVGSRPLALLAQGPIVISGTVHVNGSNATPTAPGCQARTPSPGGAGGGDGGLGTIANPGAGNSGSGPGGGGAGPASTAGAGGGGFGGNGGAGGSGGGAGGAAYGNLSAQLQGGSGGGGAGTNTGDGCQGASGGGGGGALLLSSATTINIGAGAVVSANGGNGALSDTGASGAGSGGGVTLIGQQVTNVGGSIQAIGGVGGNGGCCGGGGSGGGGRIHISAFTITAGTTVVAGGVASSGNGGGAGGAVGVITQDPSGLLYQCRGDLSITKACYARPIAGSPTQDPDVVIAGQQWICDITIAHNAFQGEGQANLAGGAKAASAAEALSPESTAQFPGIYLIDLNLTDTFPAGITYVANTVAEVDGSVGVPATCTAPPLNGPNTINCSGIDVPFGRSAKFQ
ncbi:MAG: hypothetical protein ABI780_12500, partial [Ardenticatenales bacterium]